MFCLNNYNIYVMTAHNSLYIKVRINRRIVYFGYIIIQQQYQ